MTASPARKNVRRQKSLDLDDLFDATRGYDANDGSKSVSHLGQALRKFQEGQEAAAAHRGEHDLMARSVATTGGALRSQGRRGRKKRITSSSGASVVSVATATASASTATIITRRISGGAAMDYEDDDDEGGCAADPSDGITIFTAPSSSQQKQQPAASSNLMNFLSYTNDSEKEDDKLALDIQPVASARTRRRASGSKRIMSSSASCAPDIIMTNQPSPLRASLSLGSSGLASMAQQATGAAVDRSKLRERMRRERSNDRTSSSRMQMASLRSTVSLSGTESHSNRSSHQQHHRRKPEREISDPHLLKATANVSSRMRMSSHARTRSHSDAEFSFANKDNSHPPVATRRNSKSLHGRTLSKSPHREKSQKDENPNAAVEIFSKSPSRTKRHHEHTVEISSPKLSSSPTSKKSVTDTSREAPISREAPARGRSNRRARNTARAVPSRSQSGSVAVVSNAQSQQQQETRGTSATSRRRRHSHTNLPKHSSSSHTHHTSETLSSHSHKPLQSITPDPDDMTCSFNGSQGTFNTLEASQSELHAPLDAPQCELHDSFQREKFKACSDLGSSKEGLNSSSSKLNGSQDKLDSSQQKMNCSFSKLSSSQKNLNSSQSKFNASAHGNLNHSRSNLQMSQSSFHNSRGTLIASHGNLQASFGNLEKISTHSLRQASKNSHHLYSSADLDPAEKASSIRSAKNRSVPSTKRRKSKKGDDSLRSPKTPVRASSNSSSSQSRKAPPNPAISGSVPPSPSSIPSLTRSSSSTRDRDRPQPPSGASPSREVQTATSPLRPGLGVRQPSFANVTKADDQHREEGQLVSPRSVGEGDADFLETEVGKDNPSITSDVSSDEESTLHNESVDDSADEDDDSDNDSSTTSKVLEEEDSDQDTVLQFDPTHVDNVYRVRQVTRETSTYAIQNFDGTCTEGQIAEIDDPVGDAQSLQRESGEEFAKPKKSIFDFLNDDSNEMCEEVIPFDEPSLLNGANEHSRDDDDNDDEDDEMFTVGTGDDEYKQPNFYPTSYGQEDYEEAAAAYGYGDDEAPATLLWDEPGPYRAKNNDAHWAQNSNSTQEEVSFPATSEAPHENPKEWGNSFDFGDDDDETDSVQPTNVKLVIPNQADFFSDADQPEFDSLSSLAAKTAEVVQSSHQEPVPGVPPEGPPTKLVRKVRKTRLVKKQPAGKNPATSLRPGAKARPASKGSTKGDVQPVGSDSQQKGKKRIIKKKKKPDESNAGSGATDANRRKDLEGSVTDFALDNAKASKSSPTVDKSPAPVSQPISPTKIVANLLLSLTDEAGRIKKNGRGEKQGLDAATVNPLPVPPTTELARESRIPKARKGGMGLGSIGKYFGRARPASDGQYTDNDEMSVGGGSVATRLFRSAPKKQHQLLGDDDSFDSGFG